MRAVARIDAGAIERNCARLKAAVGEGTALCAVVKGAGYGHGATTAARAALRGGATWLAVATAAEAAALRADGVEGPLLVMGALTADEIGLVVDARADVVAWDVRFVEALAAHPGSEGTGVHVKLDTGMGRLGTRDPARATTVARTVASAPGLRVAGAMTHFATADEEDPAFLHEQLDAFRPWVDAMRTEFPDAIVHAANSAATLAAPAARFDLVRCGIAIYGLDPFQRDPFAQGLEPALELAATVAAVKRVGAGGSAGYGRRFVAERDTWLATIPLGYADGVRRALTNNADVLVGGRRCPLVGTVSMDNVTVDLGPADEPPAAPGDEAVLIGAQGDERILAEELAARLGTINYEVTTGISARVPREAA